MRNKLIIFFVLLLSLSLVSSDWTPQSNINLRDTYNITGAPYINATTYYGNGSQLTGIISYSNSSDYWNDMDSINTTQMENSGGTLNFLESWLTTFWNTIFGTKDTDDLSEGSINLYDNSTFNESLTDTLYADISVSGGNLSWNESHANTLYSSIDEPLWSGNSTTIARIGDCPSGQVVVNITTGGVECSGAGTGDITSIQGDNIYIYNGSDSGDVILILNESKLNLSIETIDTATNTSMKTYVDGTFITQANEGNLNVNSSDYWDDMNTINATQMEDSSGTLNVLESWVNSLWCRLTGCTMSGDLDMNDNNIDNINNINISNISYINSLRAFDDNSISIQPTGDTDDYFSFKTPLHRPTIKREGGKFIYFDSSNVYDVGISLRDDDTYSGTLNYEKDNHMMTLLGKNSPVGIKTNSEYVNYFLFETINHIPQLSVFNGTILKINDSLEVDGYINATGKVYSEGTEVLTSYTDTNASTICSGTTTYLDGEGNCDDISGVYIDETDEGNLNVNSSDYWDGLNSPSDINAGDLTDDGTFRLNSWDNFTGIPTATPSDGDTTHLSTADQIRDYVVALTYATTSYVDGLIASVGNWSNDKSDYWNTSLDLDTVISDDEITEGKIAFSTACGAGNHYYLNGNDLACEADDDTTYTNGSAISLVGNQFNLTTCADNQIWKMDGAVWNCEADDAGAGAYTWNLSGDSGTQQTIDTTNVVDIAGGTNGIDTVVGATDTVTINLDWTEVAADAIAEGKIDMDTSCAAGNHLYVNGNNLACEADDDTTYTAGSNLTLSATVFAINMTSLKTYLDTIYAAIADANPFGASIDDTEMTAEDFGEFTCTGNEDGCTLDSGVYDDEYIELGDGFVNSGGEATISGTYGAIVVTLGNDALDDQYYDSEADLTGLLNDNYEGAGAHFDVSTTTNITCFNSACNWYTNATDSCQYYPSGGKDCGAA